MDSALYSFVVIDDEPEIREGIRDAIPWEQLGFSFAGACANGFEALELAERTRINAALIDINMPFMDGLTFAERLAEISPSTKALIITGYDDIAHVRRALRLQVYDYMVKPVTPGELRAALEKLRAALDAERAEQLNLEAIKKRLAESIPLLRERFLANLVSGKLSIEGKLSEQRIWERIAYFELPLPAEAAAYQCLALDFVQRREGEDFDLDVLAQRDILERAWGAGSADTPGMPPAVLFQDQDERPALIVWETGGASGGDGPERLYRAALKAAERLYRSLEPLGDTVIGVGEPVESLLRLNESYRSAIDALSAAALRGKRGVAAYREVLGPGGSGGKAAGSLAAWEKRILWALKTGDREGALGLVDRMAHSLKDIPLSAEEYRVKFSLLLAALMRCCEELEIPLEAVFPANAPFRAGCFLDSNPFEEIARLKSLDAARLWFSALVEGIAGFTSARQENFAKVKVREALDYLESHYADPNLSLQSLCKKLAISASYFSANLKRYHPKTFVEELTEIRLTKAMELLRTTDLLTYQIAERIGYRDSHYFSLCFRKFTGLTTTEYRNRTAEAGGP